jgi:hypothetical protein
MFMAATPSALAENPHSTQVNCAWLLRLSPEAYPHSGHLRLVLFGGTATSMPPCHLVLYSNWQRGSNGLASRMERLRPDFALTLLACCSLVPAADADIFFTCRSSTMTTAWFLLMSDETLCRKCFLVLAIRWAKCYWKNVLCSPSYFAAPCGGPPLPSATLNSRRHRIGRGLPRPEVRGLRHSRCQKLALVTVLSQNSLLCARR